MCEYKHVDFKLGVLQILQHPFPTLPKFTKFSAQFPCSLAWVGQEGGEMSPLALLSNFVIAVPTPPIGLIFFSDDDILGVELERNKENTTSPVTCPGEPKARGRISEGDENGQGQEAEAG